MQMAEIPDDERVSVMEMGRVQMSPLALLSGGASAATSPLGALGLLAVVFSAMGGGSGVAVASAAAAAGSITSSVAAQLPLLQQLQSGQVTYLMTECDAASVGSANASTISSAASSGGGFLDEGESSGWQLFSEWLQ